jgi:ABC-type dipeptide/oligopeptide/nickel transport system permease component
VSRRDDRLGSSRVRCFWPGRAPHRGPCRPQGGHRHRHAVRGLRGRLRRHPGPAGQCRVRRLGRGANPARLHATERQLHLDRGLLEQYWIWLSGLFTGKLGTSLANGEPVWALVKPRLINSAVLVFVTGGDRCGHRVVLGAVAALRKDSWFDHITSVAALAITSLPEFVVAIALIILLSTVVLHVLPAVSLLPPGTYAWSQPELLILPVATLVIVIVPYIFRMMRAAMIEALESDYVEMARLKGVPDWRLVLFHALPNAMAPTIQVIGLNFLYLAGGVVVIEFVFQLPGHRPGARVRRRQPGHPGDPVHRGGARRVLRLHEHRDRRDRAARHPTAQDRTVAMAAAVPSVPPAASARARPAGRHPWLSVVWAAARTPRWRRRAGGWRR